MYKKYFRNVSIVSLCLIFVFVYYQANKEVSVKKETSVDNYQTVVFKDRDDVLIPVSINVKSKGEDEVINRQRIELMKSSDYQKFGLYPILSKKAELKKTTMKDQTITFDFTKDLEVSNNQEALDLLESFSYMFLNDQYQDMKLEVNGQQVATLANTTIPLSSLTKNLGINNFESDFDDLTHTTSITVYNTKTIQDKEYYVPMTVRVKGDCDNIYEKVENIISHIKYDQELKLTKQCSLNNGVLKIYLESNILLDSETIDNTLYQRITKSLKTIDGVDSVKIYIDNQEVNGSKKVSDIIENRIQLSSE